MKPYDHKKIEKKWQKIWNDKKIYQTLSAAKAKAKKLKPFYVLDMFPYPSGSGLHVGHPRGYIASDVFARMKRMQGFNVLHPMGFDSFGLPTEQYAIQTGKSPAKLSDQLVKHYRDQLSILGFSYDWDRQVATHDPEFYKWTQWIFLKIYDSYYDHEKNKARPISELVKKFEKTDKNWKHLDEIEKQNILMKYRLAYEGYSEVNWCPELGTVLANDEIVEKDGKMVSERGEFPVVKKQMRQWFMRITDYAERLLSGLDTIDWPNNIKEIQKNWIGKSEGSEITFALENKEFGYFINNVNVFTTRADTLYGVSYLALAVDHPIVETLLKKEITNWDKVYKYIQDVKNQDRDNVKEITGIKLEGVYASQSFMDFEVPIYLTNYVLANYGTGAVMGVPAHDERDFEFAKKYDLPIKQVVAPLFIDSLNPPREGLPEVRRDTVLTFLRNKKNNYYALLEWHGTMKGITTTVMGGREEGETFEQAAFKEVKEEAGFEHAKLVKKSNWITEARYGALHKGQNRYAIAQAFLFEVDGLDEQAEVSAEEHKIHTLFWVPEDEVLDRLVPVHQKFVWKQMLHETALVESGTLMNSGTFDGMNSADARKAITEFVGGKMVTNYKMRDAIFARQRYWGEPIPLVHEPLNQAYPNAFEVPFYSAFPFDLILAKQKTIETRSLDKPGRDKVKVGDILRMEHLPTKRTIYVRVTAAWKFKNIREMWDKGVEIIKEIRPETTISSYEELHEFYANVDPGYEKRCDIHGLVAWRFEILEGDLIVPVPEKKLPLELPNVKSYKPSGNGESPLATVSSWVKSGYETNTMPGWAGSSWYFLRYMDPKNKKVFADEKEIDYWKNVNMYVGGAEHATGHLLYSRFWNKVLRDLGYVKTEEPFQTLRNQGLINGTDGRKMSKRWGNVINPDDVVAQFGADTMRVYESFMGPFESSLPWSTDGIVGSRRFIERVWKLQEKITPHPNLLLKEEGAGHELRKILHKTIKKVSEDIQNFSFNTAISAMMIFVNAAEKSDSVDLESFMDFLKILAPFAPHITDELWQTLTPTLSQRERGSDSIHHAPWPKYNPKLIVDDTVTLGVQVNGKVRATVTIPITASEEEVKQMVLEIPEIVKWIDGKAIRKFIYVPGKIVSVVI